MAVDSYARMLASRKGGGSGTDGKDGATFTPSVSSEGIISWTNNQGLDNPEPQNIRGPQGLQGPQGEQGPKGATGPAGYTPVKGVDYFTEADKQELVNEVLAAIPSAEGVRY